MDETDKALKKIAKGSLLIFLGIAFTKFARFISKLILIRSISQSDYGLFSLAQSILFVIGSIFLFGLPGGVSRYLAFYRRNKEKTNEIIIFSIFSSFFLGLSLFLLMWVSSGKIATFYKFSELTFLIKILAIFSPFYIMYFFYTSIFQGFERADIKVIFGDVSLYLLRLILYALGAYLGYKLIGFTLFFVLPYLLVTILVTLYSIKHFKIKIKLTKNSILHWEIILFSLPLFFSNIFRNISNNIGTIILGIFVAPNEIGLYNAVLPMTMMVSIFLDAIAFLYYPVATSLYSEKLYPQLNRVYSIMTKWVYLMSFPLFLLFFLYPVSILSFFYGPEYSTGGPIFRVILISIFFDLVLGPNAMTLAAMRHTKFLLFSSSIGASLAVLLTYLLTPTLGILGAAIAFTTGILSINFLNTTKLFFVRKMHPFEKKYLKILATSLGLTLLLLVVEIFIEITYIKIVSIIVLCLIFLITILKIDVIDKEDIMLAKSLKKRLKKGFSKLS